MKIAIVDDSKTEQERLAAFLEAWARENSITLSADTYGSGESFTAALQTHKYDVIFMDIMMDGQNGIETAKQLRKISLETLLVFITSSPEFMAQAFPCHAFDYVMKPYTQDRIMQVLDEAKRALGKPGDVIEIAGERFLPTDILYVYSDSNYCEFYTKHGRSRLRLSFIELARNLEAYPAFKVVSRGAAVNFDNTSHIDGLDCIMINGDRVPVSRRRIKEVEQAFLDRQFSKLLSEGK